MTKETWELIYALGMAALGAFVAVFVISVTGACR